MTSAMSVHSAIDHHFCPMGLTYCEAIIGKLHLDMLLSCVRN